MKSNSWWCFLATILPLDTDPQDLGNRRDPPEPARNQWHRPCWGRSNCVVQLQPWWRRRRSSGCIEDRCAAHSIAFLFVQMHFLSYIVCLCGHHCSGSVPTLEDLRMESACMASARTRCLQWDDLYLDLQGNEMYWWSIFTLVSKLLILFSTCSAWFCLLLFENKGKNDTHISPVCSFVIGISKFYVMI